MYLIEILNKNLTHEHISKANMLRKTHIIPILSDFKSSYIVHIRVTTTIFRSYHYALTKTIINQTIIITFLAPNII